MASPTNDGSVAELLMNSFDEMLEAGLILPERGSPSIVADAEARLGVTLPPEVREFYQTVQPVRESPDARYGLIAFQPADDSDFRMLESEEEKESFLWMVDQDALPAGWSDARVLVMGYTPFGDYLLRCEGLSDHPDGAIVVTDHENDGGVVMLGDNLFQWLARYIAFGFHEPAIAPASLDEYAEDLCLPFLREHTRLNPNSEWARQKLAEFGS